MQVKMAAEIGQDLNDKNEELTHELQESRSASRRSALLNLLHHLLLRLPSFKMRWASAEANRTTHYAKADLRCSSSLLH